MKTNKVIDVLAILSRLRNGPRVTDAERDALDVVLDAVADGTTVPVPKKKVHPWRVPGTLKRSA